MLSRIAVALMAFILVDPLYAEDGVSTNTGLLPSPLWVEIRGETVSVDLRDAPLQSVLREINRKRDDLYYQINSTLLSHPISCSFENIPFAEALHRILKPFNYVSFKNKKTGVQLNITSLKDGLADSDELSRIDASNSKVSGHPETPHSKPPVPNAEPLGNREDQAASRSIPDFIPVENETGPPPQGDQADFQPLPDFVPIVNETGPSCLKSNLRSCPSSYP